MAVPSKHALFKGIGAISDTAKYSFYNADSFKYRDAQLLIVLWLSLELFSIFWQWLCIYTILELP